MDWITDLGVWLSEIEGGLLGLGAAARWLGRVVIYLSTGSVEYFNDRNAWVKRYPFERYCKQGNELYLFWLSGKGVLPGNKELIKCGAIKGIILASPNSEYLALLKSSYGQASDIYDYRSNILNVTKYVREHGKGNVPIRWYRSYAGSNITIVNPNRANGFVTIEICLPYMQPSERPVIRLNKGKHEKDVLAIFEMFQNIWNNQSDDPPQAL
jgi:hypothetical protein